ncbi:MAG: flotillin-like FloA family protein, partial [Bacillota bacterium]|nr:flotillin-like FloA family protein [Bacillota bacterium]
MEGLIGLIIIVAVVIVALSVFLSFVPIGLWITAFFSGVRVGIFTLIGMRFRRVAPSRIVNPLIKATKAGLDLNIDKLEAHFLA